MEGDVEHGDVSARVRQDAGRLPSDPLSAARSGDDRDVGPAPAGDIGAVDEAVLRNRGLGRRRAAMAGPFRLAFATYACVSRVLTVTPVEGPCP